MAIQFFCTSCGKPIEIDDEAGGQMVTCPYCQAGVQAPATSDPSVRSGSTGVTMAPPPGMPAVPTSNRLGWTALGCAGGLIVCMGISFLITWNLRKDIPPASNAAEAMKIMREHPQPLGVTIFSIFGNCAVPLVGLICAIAALARKNRPLWPSVLALVVIVGYALLACITAATIISQAAAKAGAAAGG